MAPLPLVDARRIGAAAPPALPNRPTARELAVRFEALLLQRAFAPLAKAMGFYGDTIVAVASEAMLRGAGAGLTGPLENIIAAAVPEGTRR
jgi:hypothetical protein